MRQIQPQIDTPAVPNAYAAFLDAKTQIGTFDGFEPLCLPDFLFDFQRDLVAWALRKGKAAIFADCGLGKTPMQLVWAEHVVRRTNRPVLIITPLAVSAQTIEEGEKFGIGVRRSKDGAAHPDHTATGQIVRSALRYARFAGLKEAKGEPWNAEHLLYYMVPRSRAPTFLNDVSKYMDEWQSIASCHTSQLSLRDGKVGLACSRGAHAEDDLIVINRLQVEGLVEGTRVHLAQSVGDNDKVSLQDLRFLGVAA